MSSLFECGSLKKWMGLPHRAKPSIAGLPSIGDTINTVRALDLCRSYVAAGRIEFVYLETRLSAVPPQSFKDWTFDGVSVTWDAGFAALWNVPNITEIALRHDLKYAYGEIGPGEDQERKRADQELMNEVIQDGGNQTLALAMFGSVQLFGGSKGKQLWSWGFAR